MKSTSRSIVLGLIIGIGLALIAFGVFGPSTSVQETISKEYIVHRGYYADGSDACVHKETENVMISEVGFHNITFYFSIIETDNLILVTSSQEESSETEITVEITVQSLNDKEGLLLMLSHLDGSKAILMFMNCGGKLKVYFESVDVWPTPVQIKSG